MQTTQADDEKPSKAPFIDKRNELGKSGPKMKLDGHASPTGFRGYELPEEVGKRREGRGLVCYKLETCQAFVGVFPGKSGETGGGRGRGMIRRESQ
jgi:hypothetical protein